MVKSIYNDASKAGWLRKQTTGGWHLAHGLVWSVALASFTDCRWIALDSPGPLLFFFRKKHASSISKSDGPKVVINYCYGWVFFPLIHDFMCACRKWKYRGHTLLLLANLKMQKIMISQGFLEQVISRFRYSSELSP